MTEKTLDFIRHGEPVGGKRYRGQIDDPLSELGWRQMRKAVGDYRDWDVVYSSSLSRCQVFAEEVAHRLKLPLVIDTRLMEIGFGEWEGKTAAQIMETDEAILQRFWASPLEHRPPGAERLQDFSQRVIEVMQWIVSEESGARVLIVCHAGVIRMAMAHFLKMSLDAVFRIEVENASLTRIRVSQAGDEIFPRLVFHAASLVGEGR